MMDFLIGLDIGTSAIKGVLVTAPGELVSQESSVVPLLQQETGRIELDPEDHYRAVCNVIRALAGSVPESGTVAAISLSGASGNALMLDKGNNPIGNAISWMDDRAGEGYADLLPGLSADQVYQSVGWPWGPRFPLTQFAWQRRYHPDKFTSASRFIMQLTYVYYRLTGTFGVDPSTATTLYLYNQQQERWDSDILHVLNIPERSLPTVMPSGTVLGSVTKDGAAETDLCQSTRVVLGSFDHPSAARGTGVFEEGGMLLSCGTSWVGLYPVAHRTTAITCNMLADPFLQPQGPWAAMFALSGIGRSIDREIRTLVPGEHPYARFNTLAGQARPGAGDPCRSLMEDTAFELRKKIETLAAAGVEAESVTMVGGPSESPVWVGILSNILNREIKLIGGQAAGALGAAIMAGAGAGLFKDERAGSQRLAIQPRIVSPDKDEVQVYEEYYMRKNHETRS